MLVNVTFDNHNLFFLVLKNSKPPGAANLVSPFSVTPEEHRKTKEGRNFLMRELPYRRRIHTSIFFADLSSQALIFYCAVGRQLNAQQDNVL